MSKKIAWFLALCIVSMGFLVMIPSVHAEVGTIITTDTDGVPDIYFRQGDYIYYQIAMPYPLYVGEQVKITITDEDGTQWHTHFEDLDSNAEYKSWNPSMGQSSDSYYITGSEAVGPNWNISVFNASTLELLNWHIFEVYVPSLWTSTIEFYEDSLLATPTTFFPVDSRVYYTVIVVDEHDAPLQWTWVDIFVEHNSDKYNVDDIRLDHEGYGDDYFDIDWYWFSTSDQIGDYTMEVQEPLGTPLANTADFSVYEPEYSAEIGTFSGGYTTSAITFPTDGWVYWSAHIEDQHGINLPSGREIYLMVEHDGDEVRIPSSSWWDYTVDDEGNVSNNFWIGSYWNYDEQIGKYTIRVHDSNTEEQFSGSADFEVIVIKISPKKTEYAQGEEITITVTAEIFQSNINVTIYDEDWSIIEDWNDQSMANRVWTTTYTLAETLPDGQYYLLLNESATDRPLGEIMFNVKKFTLQTLPDAGAYLPGETMTLHYTVTSNKDGSGVTGTTIEYIFEYYDTQDGEWKSLPAQEFTAGASGSFPIVIPELASKTRDAELRVWANDTSDHSSYNYLNVRIGGISASLSINDNEYLAGDFVIDTIRAYVDYSYPLKNGNVHLTVSKEGVEIAAYTETNLKTDLQGRLTYIFALQDNAEIGLYTVEINVSKENEWDTDQETFEIVDERDMTLELGFDNTYYSDSDYPLYYSGDIVRVTYTALRGEEIVDNVNCEYWVYYGNNYISAGTTSAREFTFTIPADFEGRLSLYVEVTDSESNKASTFPTPAYIDVHGPSLLLNPKMPEYLPGDTVKIEYKVVGTQLPDVSYYYEIKDNRGNVIRREDLTQPSGEFQFEVPEADVPDSYSIRGWITDNNGNSIAESSAVVTRLRGYMITFSLDKNTYRPGETATLHYKITSVDDSEIPQDFRLMYGYSGGEQRSTQTSKAEGDLKIKVPEDAADGSGHFYLSSNLPYGSSYASAQQEANIRSNPNPFAETVGDMPFLSLILLILVIIALIFGIGGWRRGKKALEEAKLPPWKKEGPLPEPEKFKEPEEPSVEEPTPPPVEEEVLPPPEDTEPKPPE
jgi:hypothetical protein